MLAGLEARGAKSVFVRYLRSLNGYPTADAVLAAITTTLAWGPLMRKRISRTTAECLPGWRSAPMWRLNLPPRDAERSSV